MKRMFSMLAATVLLAMTGPAFAHREGDAGRERSGGEAREGHSRERDSRERDRTSGERPERRASDPHRNAPADADRSGAGDSAPAAPEAQEAAPTSEASVSGSGSGGSGEVNISTSSGSGSGSDGGEGDGSSQAGEDGGSSGSGGGDDDHEDDVDNSGSGSDDDDDDAIVQAGGDPERVSVEVDAAGRERRAGEVLFIGRSKDLEIVAARGYAIVSRHRLEADGDVVARVGVRGGETIERAVDALRAIAPDAQVAPNYLFRASGGDSGAAERFAPAHAAPQTQTRIGVIDTGADPQDALLHDAIHSMRSFVGPYTPRNHGTRVARIAVLNGVRVSVADVFALDRNGAPVTSGDAVIRALDWFIAQDVVVVNISITGPSSAVLSEMVARARARGMVIVAAVGNEGPGAPPAFPAALDGVVAVTAVDREGRVYRRANRGAYVDFAALGVDVAVDAPSSAAQRVSGTSFAAPVVSAVLARRLSRRSLADADAAVTALAAEVIDLGARGRDTVYGWGQVR